LLKAGEAMAAHATAMMDVSDGLLIDARRLAVASGVALTIDLDTLPLSDSFIADRGDRLEARMFAATGGDDYALLAALPADFDPGLSLSLPSGLSFACIGTFDAASTPLSLVSGGSPVSLPETLGHEHSGNLASPVGHRD